MAIDTSGKWWKGSSFEDVAEYLRLYMEDSYPIGKVAQSVCACGSTTFTLRTDPTDGCAQRICTVCKKKTLICDSEEYWEDASPRKVRCPCKNDTFEVGVGFSFREGEEDIKWVTIGHRCTACGILASSADWEINYSPSLQLLDQA